MAEHRCKIHGFCTHMPAPCTTAIQAIFPGTSPSRLVQGALAKLSGDAAGRIKVLFILFVSSTLCKSGKSPGTQVQHALATGARGAEFAISIRSLPPQRGSDAVV